MSLHSWPDVSLQIRPQQLRCVLDPLLCLSGPGAGFLQELSPYVQLWLNPGFLDIVDNWPLYHGNPRLLAADPIDLGAAEDIRHALRIWSGLRDEASHVGGPLCWVRDALRESRLPAGVDESIVPRWEAMAEALDERLYATPGASGPLIAAMRDAIALGGAVHRARILSMRPRGEPGHPPVLCRYMTSWRLPCRQIGPLDDLVVIERSLLLRLLVEAGLCGFLWGGLGLAVIHLAVPRKPQSRHAEAEIDLLAAQEPLPVPNAWEGATAFWYDLVAP